MNIAVSGALLAIIAVGFLLVYRVAKILYIAHGAVAVAGSYAFWWALERGASVVFSCAFALAVSLAFGWCMHTFVYERLRRRGKVSTILSLIASFALLILSQSVIVALFGREEQFAPLAEEWPLQAGVVPSAQIFVIACSLCCIFAAAAFLRRTCLGKIIRAVADDGTVSEASGIETSQTRCSSFLIASLLAGIAGILYAAILPFSPVTVIEIAILSSAAAIIGGAGSLFGALLGGFLLALIGDAGAFFTSEGYRALFLFVFVFIFLFIRPRGLFTPLRNFEL